MAIRAHIRQWSVVRGRWSVVGSLSGAETQCRAMTHDRGTCRRPPASSTHLLRAPRAPKPNSQRSSLAGALHQSTAEEGAMRIWIGVLLLCAAAPTAAQRATDHAAPASPPAASSQEDAVRVLSASPALSNRTRPPDGGRVVTGRREVAAAPSAPPVAAPSSPTSGPFGEFARPAPRASDPTVISRKRLPRSTTRRGAIERPTPGARTAVPTTPAESAPTPKRRASKTATSHSRSTAAHEDHRELGP